MRLIDLDSLIVEFEKRCRGECCCCTEDYCGSGNDGCGCRVIDEAPTVDAEPVKHGHWELSPFDGNWMCSNCGDEPYHSNMKNMNYCPNCGARMEVEDGIT